MNGWEQFVFLFAWAIMPYLIGWNIGLTDGIKRGKAWPTSQS